MIRHAGADCDQPGAGRHHSREQLTPNGDWQRSTQSRKQITKAPTSAASVGTVSKIIRNLGARSMPTSSKITTMGSQPGYSHTSQQRLTASGLAADDNRWIDD